jgi:rod shape-determining protein MreC
MFKRKHYFAFSAVILVTVVVLSLPSRAVSRLRLAIGGLFLPLIGAVSAAKQLPDRAADALLPRGELLKEIETLRRENEECRVRQQQADALARENAELRALVGWRQRQPWKLKLARVVLRDPANWWLSVQIDLGRRDGLTNNLPVLAADGCLVGRVTSVGYARSQVVLIGDPGCRVSARVVDPAHDLGMIGPAGPLEHSLVEMTYLPGNANLKPGQEVVTSGEGGIFPAGIPVGQIVDAIQAEYGLYTDARLKLSANLGALDQVWVLLNPQVN